MLIRRYEAIVGSKRLMERGLFFEDVYNELIYPYYEIELVENVDLGVDDAGNPILGKFDVRQNRAYISLILAPEFGDRRRSFTLWHEVGGHGILQAAWLRRLAAESQESITLADSADVIDGKTLSILEKQANWFAAHAAAPTWLVRKVLANALEPRRHFRFTGPAKYTVSWYERDVTQGFNSHEGVCRFFAHRLRHFFGGLSVEALSYRIAETGLVLDITRRSFVLHRVAS